MRELIKIYNAVTYLQANPYIQTKIGRRDSQMLHGEPFEVLEEKDSWLRGRSVLDGYTGWIDGAHKGKGDEIPTHVVHNRMSILYYEPDFKTRPCATFNFMSRVTIDPTQAPQNGFVKLQGRSAWIAEEHLLDITTLTANRVNIADTAEMFIGTPYLYGGRTPNGIDCSALVQLALQRNGGFCLRDADQQEPVLGKIVEKPRKGDLVYFNDGAALHVGIMKSPSLIINATERHKKVVVEKLDEMKEFYGGIKSIRRLTP